MYYINHNIFLNINNYKFFINLIRILLKLNFFIKIGKDFFVFDDFLF